MDDASTLENHGGVSTTREQALEFARLYSEVYALFHRVVKKRAAMAAMPAWKGHPKLKG